MPVITNSQLYTPAPTSLDIIFGNNLVQPAYDGMMDFYWEYNYAIIFLTASQLSSVPNGAVINKLNFEIDNTGTGIYDENNIQIFMATAPATRTELPSNLRINLTSGTDTAWNAEVSPVQITSSVNTTYQQQSGDPQRNWLPEVTLPTTFTYTAGTNLIISMNSKSGTYTPGSSANPKWVGKTLTGTQPKIFCSAYRYSGGAYPATTFVNYNSTFRPNIRLNWN